MNVSVFQIAGAVFLVAFGINEFTAVSHIDVVLGVSGIVAGIALLTGK